MSIKSDVSIFGEVPVELSSLFLKYCNMISALLCFALLYSVTAAKKYAGRF